MRHEPLNPVQGAGSAPKTAATAASGAVAAVYRDSKTVNSTRHVGPDRFSGSPTVSISP